MLREMTRDEIAFIVRKHVEAAIRAKKAGYDGVNLDIAYGIPSCLFLSPKRNRRADEYGGEASKTDADSAVISSGR
jgi:NADPH2 dehydrogenase